MSLEDLAEMCEDIVLKIALNQYEELCTPHNGWVDLVYTYSEDNLKIKVVYPADGGKDIRIFDNEEWVFLYDTHDYQTVQHMHKTGKWEEKLKLLNESVKYTPPKNSNYYFPNELRKAFEYPSLIL
jgi:hypothetical protein